MKLYNRRHKLSAFTLIELMVVIAILAVLAGMGIGSYRKALDRNAYFEDIENLSGEITSMPGLAKSVGLLIDAKNNSIDRDSSTEKTAVQSGGTITLNQSNGLVWKSYKNGVQHSQGIIGTRGTYEIKIEYSKGYKYGVTASTDTGTTTVYSESLKKGSWISFYKAKRNSQNAQSKTPEFSIIFLPDGTPLYSGYIKATCPKLSTKITNIKLEKFGGVTVNDAVGI